MMPTEQEETELLQKMVDAGALICCSIQCFAFSPLLKRHTHPATTRDGMTKQRKMSVDGMDFEATLVLLRQIHGIFMAA